jgi:hypothetical protein
MRKQSHLWLGLALLALGLLPGQAGAYSAGAGVAQHHQRPPRRYRLKLPHYYLGAGH